ncbi:MAG: tRNA 2-thiouridine(34) synthase MnmA [Synergistaceae bacterium]|jgi:tRNA-specific 2-thiouridylase|nr:tRNA 2-thiouridine(34) synthase MnmA [Synergistaceae bacterium]
MRKLAPWRVWAEPTVLIPRFEGERKRGALDWPAHTATIVGMNNNVMIAMSGGVDSSVAACLLVCGNLNCCGVTMKLFGNDDAGLDREDVCCSAGDAEDARSVARKLGIPHFVFNLSRDFDELVIRRFVDTYLSGGTPNPCIDCNRRVKFERLLRRAREAGYDRIATGHYARAERSPGGRHILMKALDETKDQSYVLYSMTQDQLARTLLPLGGMRKHEVREIARAHGLRNSAKPDSQDICFVREGTYADFIERRSGRGSEPGDFVGTDGSVIGRHRGLVRYTIGQRRGLGVGFSRRMYVCGKDTARNTVTLGGESELYSKWLHANEINLVACDSLDRPMRVTARTRYRQSEQPAVLEQVGADIIRVEFDEPVRSAAPGQAVVLYDGDVVVAGGTIIETGQP